MEKQNIKEYILDLATECILHSEKALVWSVREIRNLYLTQAFYCAKKLQELYFFRYQNAHIKSFYTKFYYFNEKCAESNVCSKDVKNLLQEFKDILSELKTSLSQ